MPPVILKIEGEKTLVRGLSDLELADVELQIDGQLLCPADRPRLPQHVDFSRLVIDVGGTAGYSRQEQSAHAERCEEGRFHGFCVGRMMISLIKLFGS